MNAVGNYEVIMVSQSRSNLKDLAADMYSVVVSAECELTAMYIANNRALKKYISETTGIQSHIPPDYALTAYSMVSEDYEEWRVALEHILSSDSSQESHIDSIKHLMEEKILTV